MLASTVHASSVNASWSVHTASRSVYTPGWATVNAAASMYAAWTAVVHASGCTVHVLRWNGRSQGLSKVVRKIVERWLWIKSNDVVTNVGNMNSSREVQHTHLVPLNVLATEE